MSENGLNFFESWIQQNIAEADKLGNRARTKELANRCITEALAISITIDDMEPGWHSVETTSMRRYKTT